MKLTGFNKKFFVFDFLKLFLVQYKYVNDDLSREAAKRLKGATFLKDIHGKTGYVL